MKKTAVYVRVSTRDQSEASQLPDLERWAQGREGEVVWFRDSFTGRTLDRPGMQQLLAAVHAGQVETVAVWRLDRLGRTAKGLTALFEDLGKLGVGLVSLKENLDLSTPAGRLMACIVASVAAYETEIRGERVKAGVDAARAKGKRWGGSKPGWNWRVTPEKRETVLGLHAAGKPIAQIARIVELSRPTIYAVLDAAKGGELPLYTAELADAEKLTPAREQDKTT
jgi:DNA invertase Pin-like site-specific DNA recombinase